jgi:type IV secretory pathway TrbD component
MSETRQRRNQVFKSLHKPLTYMGIERKVFFFVCVAAVGCFNLFNSLLAGFVVFVGGAGIGYWMTNEDPAFLQIIGKSEKFKPRYDAAKQQLPNVEIR